MAPYCGSKGEQNFVRELVQLKIEDKEEGEAKELKKRDDLYEQLMTVAKRKTAEADVKLDSRGKPIEEADEDYGDNVLIVERDDTPA